MGKNVLHSLYFRKFGEKFLSFLVPLTVRTEMNQKIPLKWSDVLIVVVVLAVVLAVAIILATSSVFIAFNLMRRKLETILRLSSSAPY